MKSIKNPVYLMPDFFMEKLFKHTFLSPIGFLELTSSPDSLLAISFAESSNYNQEIEIPEILHQAELQLKEYFQGKRKSFNLKIYVDGTGFQQKVWNEVAKIPFGETKTYLDVALITGSEKHTRAVGLANGKNPLPIVIPCHRVIGQNGKLTGYAGGIDKKKWLLLHELEHSKRKHLLF